MPYKGERPLLMRMGISLSNEILNYLRASPLTAIDIAREINRYLRPNIRYAGRGAQAIDTIKKDLAKKIQDVFLVEDT